MGHLEAAEREPPLQPIQQARMAFRTGVLTWPYFSYWLITLIVFIFYRLRNTRTKTGPKVLATPTTPDHNPETRSQAMAT